MQHGYNVLSLEIDSLMVANMLKDKVTNDMKLRSLIEDTSQIFNQATIKIAHCYREANQVADGLAKLATTLEEVSFYHTFQQLPEMVKGPFQLDKCQMPSIRLRYDKANFFIS